MSYHPTALLCNKQECYSVTNPCLYPASRDKVIIALVDLVPASCIVLKFVREWLQVDLFTIFESVGVLSLK